ncbi:hypothetical protein OZX73_05430 [Bifidobacterium sp. ESL0775]|uniref:hypothetical protein n=1 Tax=Bifidobacterium sp. ESL0775 TaxID=2983230 RepID=UPI0023F807DC|nr:hypothetical protein [Bifidobacterium sp. ESL0775]WEV68734.1 hypothetical protein OZX73_05430 [Bifidobacterium sp. ESL0775]
MDGIEFKQPSNSERLPEWARGILPEPPKEATSFGILCASADRILTLFEMTGDPDLNERLHDAIDDLCKQHEEFDTVTAVYWMHVIGWIFTNPVFFIPTETARKLEDEYHQLCLRMSRTPFRKAHHDS